MLYIYDNNIHNESLIDFFSCQKTKIRAKVQQPIEEILYSIKKPGYFVFHINLTNTAKFYIDKQKLIHELLKRKIKPINAFIEDISKTYIQNCCQTLFLNNVVTNIQPNDNVIIKSNLNFNNIPETRLTQEEKNRLGICSNIQTQTYKIVKYKDINNESILPNSVIEKFIENDKNFFYRVYKFYNYYVISEVTDLNQIKKMPEGINRISYYFDTKKDLHKKTRFCSIIEQTEKLSSFINLDYGTFDVVKSNKNEFYIIDVNLTPYWGNGIPNDLNKITQYLQNFYNDNIAFS